MTLEHLRSVGRSHGKFWTGDRLATLLIICWPFVFLWPYTFRQISIANDFIYLYWNYKAYLLASLTNHHFPLWSPTESAGYPFFSNPYAQAFYPLNILYLLFYAVYGSFSSWNYTLFTIMALSIFGVGLFFWLRRLHLATHVACIAVIIALMSLKLTETIRFPNAAHSAAWMPWLLFGITLAAHRRHLVAGSLVFAASALMLMTAGYPYYVVYAAFLVGPYFLAMVIPSSRATFLDLPKEQQTGLLKLVMMLAAAFAVPAAIAFPWLKHVGVLLSQTVDRGTPVFAFATEHRFTLMSTIGSWIFPPAAPMEGWYYFGMATTLLIGSYLCCVVAGRGVEPRHRVIALMILCWFLLVTYFTWGADSAFFTFVWHHVPVLDQMRVWGRLNIVLVPALACLLALSLHHLASLLDHAMSKPSPGARIFFVAVGVLSMIIFAAQICMAKYRIFDDYWSVYFRSPSVNWSELKGVARLVSYRLDENFFAAMTALAASCVLGIGALAQRGALLRPTTTLMRAVIIVSAIDLFYVANLQWPFPFNHLKVVRDRTPDLVNAGFAQPRQLTGNSVDPATYTHNAGIFDAWNFVRHASFFTRFFDSHGAPRPGASLEEIAAAARLYGADNSAQRIFFTSRIDFTSPVDFVADVDATAATANAAVAIEYYDGDILRLNVRSDQPVWISFIDSWDPHWTASIDRKDVPISLLFGSYKSVRIESPGQHDVTFSYRPPLLP
jgi:hypothetical protein